MQSLVEKYKPETLSGFAGLDRPKKILAHIAANPYSSAWLLFGPSGIGKTTMALALAKQINGEVHHIPSKSCDLATVEAVCERCHYVPFGGGYHVLIVDEADQMSRAAQLAFLSKLDTTAAPPDTIFLFTANSTSLLEDRFISRCRTLQFDLPSESEIIALLSRVYAIEAPRMPAPDLAAIVRDSKGNIRECLMRLELEIITGPAEPAAVHCGSVEDNRAPLDSLDAYAVARHLGINVATLYNRIKMGRIPEPDRSGRKMLWTRSQIEVAA